MEGPAIVPQRVLSRRIGFGKPKVHEINLITCVNEDVVELEVVVYVTRSMNLMEDREKL